MVPFRQPNKYLRDTQHTMLNRCLLLLFVLLFATCARASDALLMIAPLNQAMPLAQSTTTFIPLKSGASPPRNPR